MVVGIVGLGLIGGSIAKTLRRTTSHHVLGMDIAPDIVLRAKLLEAIDDELTEERLSECDAVFVALYPEAAVDFISRNAARFRDGAIVTDCCGVKRAVCEPLAGVVDGYGFHFIGGHPMAGVEFSGFAHARKTLFEKASMILTPYPGADIRAVDKLKKLCLEMGFGRVVITTPHEHDEMIAYTSQLAHIVSSAYVRSDAALSHRGFSAGSFRDMTRVAKLNETMWAELFLKNSEPLLDELDGLIERFSEYRKVIAQSDEAELKRLLKEGCEYKARAEANKSG